MSENKEKKSIVRGVISFLLSVLIIAGGVFGAWYMMHTAPMAKKRPPAPISALVKVETLKLENTNVKISAMGTAIPTIGLSLKPKITGIVEKFGDRYGSGYIVPKGEPLIYIENTDQKADYELARAALIQAKASLQIEIGSQEVAKRELGFLQKSSVGANIVFENQEDADLVLRKPQLEIAQAAVLIAEANLTSAQNNLDYTVVKAPFNAFIEGNVSTIGMLATPTTSFCELYGTDDFWVDATVTQETLKYLDIPNWSTDAAKGSKVELHIKGTDGTVGTRIGDVRRMRGMLQDGDNMVRLMIKIDDPLCLLPENKGKEKILLSSKLEVVIHGKELQNVYEIPRSAWREDKEIWVVDANKKLKKLEPELIWRTKTTVFISPEGIEEGTQIITSPLSMAVDGLALNILNEEESK